MERTGAVETGRARRDVAAHRDHARGAASHLELRLRGPRSVRAQHRSETVRDGLKPVLHWARAERSYVGRASARPGRHRGEELPMKDRLKPFPTIGTCRTQCCT